MAKTKKQDTQNDPGNVEVIEAEIVDEDQSADLDHTEDEISDPEPAAVSKSGPFLPLVLGGLIAGGIGFGAAMVGPIFMGDHNSDAVAKLTTENKILASDIATLKSEISTQKKAISQNDVAGQFIEMAANFESMQGNLTDLGGKILVASDRISVLEKRPFNASVSPEAIKAYEAELEKLSADVTQQQDAINLVAEQAALEIEKARTEAKKLEANAAAIAQKGVAQAAIGKIQAALNTGAGYAEALAELANSGLLDIPVVLSDRAPTGVSSLQTLQSEFPDAARSALASSRSETGQETGFGGFLKSQFGVRSLTPQEGFSTDAILSRVQFQLDAGNLTAVLSEIDGLDQTAKSAVSSWKLKVETRLSAAAAAQSLFDTIAQN